MRERLDEILLLLESGNLEAVERFEALARHQHPLPRRFQRFHELIQSLDFRTALQVGRDLLKEL